MSDFANMLAELERLDDELAGEIARWRGKIVTADLVEPFGLGEVFAETDIAVMRKRAVGESE